MKREKIDLSQERQIIINMIVSTPFLREISKLINPKYFKSPYGRIVSRWILEYFQKYKEAPKKQIQDIFYQKSSLLKNSEDIEDVSEFLSSLSKEYEKSEDKNIKYIVENTVHYLKLRSLENLRDKLDKSIIENDPLTAEQSISNYSRIERIEGIGVSLLSDTKEIMTAFMEEEEKLFRFPGIFGEVCGDFLRGDLVAFLAASKKGKTWFLLYTAETAASYGYKVVFFTLEMTKNQILRRSWQLLSGQPRKTGEILIPRFEKCLDGKKEWKVILEKKTKRGVNVSKIKREQRRLKSVFRNGDVKIVPLPAYSATVEDLEAYLDNLYYYENYIPDVVIIDYADIIAPSRDFRGDYRHQIDNIWKKIRKIGQERNALPVTASQAGRGSFSRDAKEEDIVEDIRKIAHVGKMIVINQNEKDAEMGAVRIAQLVERDGRRNYKQALLLQCLEIGRPYLDSKYANEVFLEKDNKNDK